MPDFGIFRGFNDKLFGDKLYAGQLPTQLGLIGSDDFGFDVDAQAFFDRVTNAGGTLSATEKLAIDALVRQMKTDGIWTKMKAIYPMVGASAAACAQNLKSSSFTGSFSGGWTFSSMGATPNGINAFYNTLLNPSVELTQNNISIGFYSGTNINAYSGQPIGAISPPAYLRVIPWDGNNLYMDLNDGSNSALGRDNRTDGFLFGYRTSSNQKVMSRRGTLFTFNESSTGIVNQNIFLGAYSSNNNPQQFSIYQNRFAFVGEALTNTEANAYFNSVQAFQTTLSRQV